MEETGEHEGEVDRTEPNNNGEYERQTAEQGCWKRVFPTDYKSEFKKIINLSWALILVEFCQIALQPATIIFAGHLGKFELETVALSVTIITITGYSVVWGMGTACDTVFSQTYGSNNKKLVGVQVQRALIIHFLTLCVCWALHLNIEGILRVLGQDHEVSRLVGQYVLLFMPGMLFLFAFVVLRKWIQCQNKVNPLIAIGFLGFGVSIFFQWFLMFFMQLGMLGSVLAQDITYFVLLAALLIYIFVSGVYKDTWTGWDLRMFEDWGEFSLLALFGMLMTCLESWAFEATVLLAGTVGATELSAQSVIFSVDGMLFAVPNGIAVALTIRVGQSLGAGKPSQARTSTRIGFIIGAWFNIIISLLLVVFRNELPGLLTSVEEVEDLVASVIPIVAFYSIMDALCTIARGVMRGCGKQASATVIIIIGYYVLALPLGISLLYLTSLKTIGLWIGLAAGLTIDALVYMLYINRKLDWVDLSKTARRRARVESIHVKNTVHDPGEETPLLKSSNDVPIYGVAKNTNFDNCDSHVVSGKLICSRILIILGFIGLVAISVVCKLYINIPVDWDLQHTFNCTGSQALTLWNVAAGQCYQSTSENGTNSTE